MKILHTSDWHLGRTFKSASLHDDHAHILDQVLDILVRERADALIIAGDVFDRAAPPATSVALFDDFLKRAYHDTTAAIIVIAGNHDSGERIGMNAVFADPKRALIRGRVLENEPPLILEDAHGPVAFSALPYGETYAARDCFGDATIASPADVMAAQVNAARKDLPASCRWVVSAHAFVAGGQSSESERMLSAGGVETTPPDTFKGADYVALGHLHRAQTAGAPHIRYSGSPLAFGFDEAGLEKSVSMVTLNKDGFEGVETIALSPRRRVIEMKGALDDLEKQGAANPSDDFIRAVLTDDGALVDPMARLRRVYPNTLEITRERKAKSAATRRDSATSNLNDPQAVMNEFLAYVRQSEPHKDEAALIKDALDKTLADKDH